MRRTTTCPYRSRRAALGSTWLRLLIGIMENPVTVACWASDDGAHLASVNNAVTWLAAALVVDLVVVAQVEHQMRLFAAWVAATWVAVAVVGGALD